MNTQMQGASAPKADACGSLVYAQDPNYGNVEVGIRITNHTPFGAAFGDDNVTVEFANFNGVVEEGPLPSRLVHGYGSVIDGRISQAVILKDDN